MNVFIKELVTKYPIGCDRRKCQPIVYDCITTVSSLINNHEFGRVTIIYANQNSLERFLKGSVVIVSKNDSK